MARTIYVGGENSNSSNKLLTDSRSYHEPNTIRKLRSTSRVSIRQRNDIFEVDGNLYQVGFDDGYGSGSKDESRYTSEQFRLEFGIALSRICNNGDKLKLVTGLPANLANRDDIITNYKNNLFGKYTVKHKGATKTFTVDDITVVAQPVGTLWSLLYDIEGNQRVDDDTFDKNFLFIDIGRGTTDIVVVSASRGIDDEQTITLNMGTQEYLKDLYRIIELEHPTSRLTSTDISINQLDKMLINKDILDIQTGTFNVRDIKKDIQDSFALDIKQRLDNFGYNIDRYHQIILTGGGSAIMERAIKNAYNNNKRIQLIDNPIMSNVTGFYIMARQIHG